MLSEGSRQIRALSNINSHYRQAYENLEKRYNILYNTNTQLSDYLNQLQQENAAPRAECGHPPLQFPFSLQHPNNVQRAKTARQQETRRSDIGNLREPDGGLVLGDQRAPPPPTALLSTQAGKLYFGAAGESRSLSSGKKNEGEEKELDADSGPGPAIVDDEKDNQR